MDTTEGEMVDDISSDDTDMESQGGQSLIPGVTEEPPPTGVPYIPPVIPMFPPNRPVTNECDGVPPPLMDDSSSEDISLSEDDVQPTIYPPVVDENGVPDPTVIVPPTTNPEGVPLDEDGEEDYMDTWTILQFQMSYLFLEVNLYKELTNYKNLLMLLK